ncbi:MAG: propionyl-CoA carboxylase [Alphaproteobacteria bacterium]|nr:propionyl-CoA carboxylase [Alphaproteobacteria bacterium]
MSWKQEADEIRRRRELAKQQGGEDGVARQHAKGRLTVRERIAGLVDDGSFDEQGETAGQAEFDEAGNLVGYQPANYVMGFGKLGGRRVVVGGEDFTLKGGSPNAAGLRKSVFAEDMAIRYRVPLVRFLEGGGGSVAGASGKGLSFSPVYDRPRFRSLSDAMATVPVASAACGPVAGFPAARLAASHFSVMTKETAQVLVAGPAVVERALGVSMTKEELGGHQVHLKNGTVDNLARDEQDAFDQVRRFLSYMPQNVWELPPVAATDDDPGRADEALLEVIPRDRRKPYDGRKLVAHVVDTGSFFEVGRRFGPGQIVGLARLNGRPVGVIAADCRFAAGAMTANGSQKVRRFVDLCDTFHLPVLSFVDEPGFMIGPDAEQAGTIRYGTALVLAVMQSRVPWASIVVRKSFGVAAAAHYGPDGLVLAWPSAEMGALPVEGGVAVAYARQLAQAEDPAALRAELEAKMAAANGAFPRGEQFNVHELIDPRETRRRLCTWLEWIEPLLESQKGPTFYPIRP